MPEFCMIDNMIREQEFEVMCSSGLCLCCDLRWFQIKVTQSWFEKQVRHTDENIDSSHNGKFNSLSHIHLIYPDCSWKNELNLLVENWNNLMFIEVLWEFIWFCINYWICVPVMFFVHSVRHNTQACTHAISILVRDFRVIGQIPLSKCIFAGKPLQVT